MTAPEQARRLGPIIGLIASGKVKLDETMAPGLAKILDAHARKLDGLGNEQ